MLHSATGKIGVTDSVTFRHSRLTRDLFATLTLHGRCRYRELRLAGPVPEAHAHTLGPGEWIYTLSGTPRTHIRSRGPAAHERIPRQRWPRVTIAMPIVIASDAVADPQPRSEPGAAIRNTSSCNTAYHATREQHANITRTARESGATQR